MSTKPAEVLIDPGAQVVVISADQYRDFKYAQQDLTIALDGRDEAIRSLKDITQKLRDTTQKLDEERVKTVEAQHRIVDAQDTIVKLNRDVEKFSRFAEDKFHERNDALEKLEDAQMELAQAHADLADVRANAARHADAAADHRREIDKLTRELNMARASYPAGRHRVGNNPFSNMNSNAFIRIEPGPADGSGGGGGGSNSYLAERLHQVTHQRDALLAQQEQDAETIDRLAKERNTLREKHRKATNHIRDNVHTAADREHRIETLQSRTDKAESRLRNVAQVEVKGGGVRGGLIVRHGLETVYASIVSVDTDFSLASPGRLVGLRHASNVKFTE